MCNDAVTRPFLCETGTLCMALRETTQKTESAPSVQEKTYRFLFEWTLHIEGDPYRAIKKVELVI